MFRNSKVLIVEDHDPSREALRKLLSQIGFTVNTAANCAEGLAKLGDQSHVLLDLNLPDGCGTEIFRRVRELHKSMKVAIITGDHRSSPTLMEALRLQPDIVCHKPLDFDKLRRWLEA